MYMKNRPTEVKPAYLKIVPYWVTKKPSDPYLITSAISCIDFGPRSLPRMSQSIDILIPRKMMEQTNALNEIKLLVDWLTST